MQTQALQSAGKTAALSLVSRMNEELQSLKLCEIELCARISLLNKTISGLVTLANLSNPMTELPTSSARSSERLVTLPDDCALLLRSSPEPLTIGEICSKLVLHMRPRKNQAGDFLFAVSQSLQQLADCGLVRATEVNGTRRWRWAGVETHSAIPVSEFHAEERIAGSQEDAQSL